MNAAREAIDELGQVTGWLACSLLPGTPKPWTAPLMSDEKLAARAMQDRTYRAAAAMSAMIPLGESPAPLDLTTLDLLVEILCLADEIADLCSDAAEVPRLAAASSWMADPAPFLARGAAFVAYLDKASQRRVEERCDDLTYRALGSLGLMGDGQVLAVVCPWCLGRTPQRPVGGARTLRVRAVLPAGERSLVKVDPDDIDWLIVCEGVACEPPSKDCGERHRGRPAWSLTREGEHLAKLLEKAAVVEAAVEIVVASLAS